VFEIMKHKGGFHKGNLHKGGKGAKSVVKSTRDEINEIMESVKEFNAKSLEGGKKAAHKDDILTKLGAFPPKQQKMPYAMRLGLNAAKKKRDVKNAQLAKEAQIQLPQSFSQQNKKKRK
jgi:hypothetical protein